jgi:hypothetical protein
MHQKGLYHIITDTEKSRISYFINDWFYKGVCKIVNHSSKRPKNSTLFAIYNNTPYYIKGT